MNRVQNSIQIDLIMSDAKWDGTLSKNTAMYPNGWKTAKPTGWYGGFFERLQAAWRVLIGKSGAYHFQDDEGSEIITREQQSEVPA